MGIVRGDLSVLAPATGAFSISPADGVQIKKTRGLYVGVSGDVAVTMSDGTEVTFVDLAAGIEHPLSVIEVKSTGTNATSIIGLT